MGRSKMAFHLARLVCPPLLCLLLSVLAQVSGRSNRKHYLIKTEDNDDYIRIKNNDYSGSAVSTSPGSPNIQKDEDYTGSDQNEAGTDYAGDDYIGPKGPIGLNYEKRCRTRRLARSMRLKCDLNGYYYTGYYNGYYYPYYF